MGRKKGEVLRDLELMSLCAYLYYKKDISQEEIAIRFGITKSYVSKILKAAMQEGVVDVKIQIPLLTEKAGNLIARYGLRQASVIPALEEDWIEAKFEAISNLKRNLGEGAAKYLESPDGPLHSGSRIGVSCGVSPLSTILSLRERGRQQLTITPLSVESVPELAYQAPSTLVGLLQAKYPEGTEAYGPQLIPQIGNAAKNVFESIRRRIEKDAKYLDLAIVGIGSVNLKNKKQSYTQILIQAGVAPSELKDAVGEINNRPYDKDGNDLFEKHPNLGKHIIAVSLKQLQALSRSKESCVMAVAGGKGKIQAIRVALENGFINTLVTDSLTAEHLLQDKPE